MSTVLVDLIARMVRRKHEEAAYGPQDREAAVALFAKALPQAPHILPLVLEVSLATINMSDREEGP